jgi:hypothetical protein
MQNRVVFPLLFFRSVESSVFGVALVKNAPVWAPFLDTRAFKWSGSYFPPAACVYRNGVDTGVDVAELAAFLA